MLTGPANEVPAPVNVIPGGIATVIIESFCNALIHSSILILSIISSGFALPFGSTPTGKPASDFLLIISLLIFIADNPLDCVAIGTGMALDHMDLIRSQQQKG